MNNRRDDSSKQPPYPGMLGDETEEQNLNQPGNPKARITEDEAKDAFEKARPVKK